MKKEAGLKRKTGAVFIAGVMIFSAFASAPYTFAETEDGESNAALQAVEAAELQEATVQEVAVESIRLNRTGISIAAGQKITLAAVVEPAGAADAAITWKSSDDAVATVVNGIVTAEGPGKAEITAAAGGRTAVCSVNVSFKAPKSVHARSLNVAAVQVTWKETKGADAYEIFRSTKSTGTYKKIALVKGKLAYKDSACKVGQEHFYKVRACRGNARSEFSKVVSEKARPRQTVVRVKAGEEKVTVSWKKVKGVQGYHVYYKASKKDKYKRIGIIRQKQPAKLVQDDLKGGKTYYYKVRSYKMVKGKKVFSHSSKQVAVKAKKVKLKTHKSGFQYKKKMIVKAYAYTGGGRTASGTAARKGAIAVDPRVIPLGTKVYVEGYGYAKAEDTGGNIKGRTVDLYMNSGSACMRWGVRYKTVYLDVRK